MKHLRLLPGPAKPGSLSPEARAHLTAYSEFIANRDRALLGLYGRRLKRSMVRDELVRAIVIEFGEGRIRSVAWYGGYLLHVGNNTAVREQVRILVKLHLVMLRPDSADSHADQVVPTQRLVDWYDDYMGRLLAEVRDFLAQGRRALPALTGPHDEAASVVAGGE